MNEWIFYQLEWHTELLCWLAPEFYTSMSMLKYCQLTNDEHALHELQFVLQLQARLCIENILSGKKRIYFLTGSLLIYCSRITHSLFRIMVDPEFTLETLRQKYKSGWDAKPLQYCTRIHFHWTSVFSVKYVENGQLGLGACLIFSSVLLHSCRVSLDCYQQTEASQA